MLNIFLKSGRSNAVRALAGRSFWKARPFHSTTAPMHGHDHDDPNAVDVRVTYILKDGEEKEVIGKTGQNLLRLGQKYDIPLEGACEGVCACSTCHVILEDATFDMLPEAEDEEEDMFGLGVGFNFYFTAGLPNRTDGRNGRYGSTVAKGDQKFLCRWTCTRAPLRGSKVFGLNANSDFDCCHRREFRKSSTGSVL